MTPLTPEEFYDFTYNDVMQKLEAGKVRIQHVKNYLFVLTDAPDNNRTAHQRAQHMAQLKAYSDYIKRCKTEELLDM